MNFIEKKLPKKLMIILLIFLSNSFSLRQDHFLNSKFRFNGQKILSDSNSIFDTRYNKTYINIGRVGFYGEYLRKVSRSIPELKSEDYIPIDRIPTYNSDLQLNTTEKEQVLNESIFITAKSVAFEDGTYEILDENGNLYLNNSIVETIDNTTRKLYKHYGSIGNYEGNVSDSEPAYVKRMTFYTRGICYQITGLYAPPGEVISVRIREKDLHSVGKLYVSIGPIYKDDRSNNIIHTNNDFNRMPIQTNLFELTTKLEPCDRDGTDYIFHIGSFLGGPIYIRPNNMVPTYSVTIKGAVRYLHYIHGYTSEAEFNEDLKSTSPYFDFEIWSKGIVHSGPRSRVPITTYQEAYDLGVFGEKVTSIANQLDSKSKNKCPMTFMYDCFFIEPRVSGVCCDVLMSLPYLTNALNVYREDVDYDTRHPEEIWTQLHNYNGHFSSSWGLSSCRSESTDALILIDYSLFTNVSQIRYYKKTLNSDDSFFKFAYLSAFLSVSDCVSKSHFSHVSLYATLLHCFGQKVFIEACKKKYGESNDGWHRSFTELTTLDMTYFFNEIYKAKPISSQEKERFKGKNYKKFIPVACLYQTGIGYIINNSRKSVFTMQPYLIDYDKEFIFDLNENIVLPSGFSFIINSITKPDHGNLKKLQQDGLYSYIPDPNYLFSGIINLSLSIIHTSIDSIDDVEIYIEFQQSHNLRKKSMGSYVLDKKVCYYENSNVISDPVHEFQSNYSSSFYCIDLLNENANQDSNCEIWDFSCVTKAVSELRGKVLVKPSKYRFQLRGYKNCALFLSFDDQMNYFLAVNLKNENYSVSFDLDDVVNYYDHKFDTLQWVHFKIVLIDNCSEYGVSFAGIGIGEFQDDDQVTVSYIKNAVFEDFVFGPQFYSDVVYPPVFTQARNNTFPNKGTLLDSNYYKMNENDMYDIENLFDDNERNFIHTDELNRVSEENPFMIFVDLNEVIVPNRLIIYGPIEEFWHQNYLPKDFTLEVGTEQDDLQIVSSNEDSILESQNIVSKFNINSVRYYQLNVTFSHDTVKNYIAFRMIRLMSYFTGFLVSIDDDRVTLFNSWSKESKQSTFGQLYVAKGSQNTHSKAVFLFSGSKFAINAFKSDEFDGFDVYIDSEKVATINLKGTDKTVRCVYINDTILHGHHNVTIDGGSHFNVDSFIVGDDSVVPDETIYDNEFQIFTDDDYGKEQSRKMKKLSGGVIAAIVISVVIVVMIISVVVYDICKRKKVVNCSSDYERDPKLDEKLLKASNESDFKTICKLLDKKGIDINCKDILNAKKNL